MVLLNILLRFVGTKLVDVIGLHHNDDTVMYILSIIYAGSYFNTAILLVLASAHLEYTPISFLGINNQFADYSNDWYLVVGEQIYTTMLIQAFIPYFNFIIMYSVKFFQRFLDSKSSMFKEYPKTNLRTKEAFIQLYSGPDLQI